MSVFQRSDIILRHFIDHVRSISSTFNSKMDRYYGLYFSIVQSSGYGKSRIIVECCLQNLLSVAYMCLRKPDVSGFPLATRGQNEEKSILSFLKKHNNVRKLEFFIAMTHKVCTDVCRNNENLSKYAGKDFSFSSLWEKVMIGFEEAQADFESLIDGYKKHQLHIDTKMPELLIVFDEARVLLEEQDNDAVSIFRNLRRAQYNLGSKSVVLVFIDTLSTVTNFSPAKKFETSGRIDQVDYDLLPPYYEVLSYNSYLVNYQKSDYQRELLEELAETFSHGRPLWTALFLKENVLNNSFLYNAIIFACRKLACSTNLEKTKLDPGLANSLNIIAAMMSIRYGIRGIIDHYLALNLMKAHLGTGTINKLVLMV